MDLHDKKWLPVKNKLQEAVTGNDTTFYINDLSGYGNIDETFKVVMSYFIASGRVTFSASAYRLPTFYPCISGMYPDFPQSTAGICWILFEGVNILTKNQIVNYNKNIQKYKRTVGIVMADFPGDWLIEAIIKNNAIYKKKSRKKKVVKK